MRRGVVVLLVLALLVAVGPVDAQAPAKVKLGVLKLTSSAVLFLGVEKGYFKEFGIEPELVYFQAAQPIAVALASGDIPVGATGLTAGLFNIVAGGVRIWIVADKGREWPNHNLTALVVRKDLYDGGVRSMRDLKGKKIGVTQIGSTFHYNVGRYLEKEGLAPGDVELVPLQALPALNDALTAKRVDAVATAEPFVSRLETTGAGVTIVQTGDAFPWQIATVMYLRPVRARPGPRRQLHEGLRQGLALLLRRGAGAPERAAVTTRSWRSPRSTRAPAPTSSARAFPTRTVTDA